MSTPAPLTPSGPPDKHWVDQATEAVESLVLTVKEKTTVPATTAARAVVYGLVILALGITALVVLTIASVRFLTVYLPVGRAHHHHRVWVAYLIVGLILTLAGLLLWSRRVTKETDA